MALSANPSGNQDGTHNPSSFNGGGNPNNGNSGAVNSVPHNSGSTQALKHNPGLAVEWSSDEQLILDEGLSKYASESNIVRYAKIAMELQDKTVRDVALRCRWMTKKEMGKRRKEDHMARKSKDKKEKVTDPSVKPSTHLAARPNIPPYTLPMLPIDNDDGISYKAIGGATGLLLEQNAHVFNQISANLSAFQIQENFNLFCQTRDNILTILNDMNDMPGIMKQMPPLPVKVNEELANSILPRTSLPMQS
ncbi:uncharacterized protein LOC143860761 [Tasmannia lanceolata]|uniref:uncharacterized protein LOC143860761 n=1 Tax=Tasmannia lanceolata TaxID=3420 RepID=UPI004064B8AB